MIARKKNTGYRMIQIHPWFLLGVLLTHTPWIVSAIHPDLGISDLLLGAALAGLGGARASRLKAGVLGDLGDLGLDIAGCARCIWRAMHLP